MMMSVTRSSSPEEHHELERRLRLETEPARAPLPRGLGARIQDALHEASRESLDRRRHPRLAMCAMVGLLLLAAGVAVIVLPPRAPTSSSCAATAAGGIGSPLTADLQEIVRRGTPAWAPTISLETEMHLLERDTRTAAKFVLTRLPLPRSARDRLPDPVEASRSN